MRVKIRMIQMILILENGVNKIYWITWNKNPGMYTTKIPECIPQKSRNVFHKNPGMYTTKIPECIPQKSRNVYHKSCRMKISFSYRIVKQL